MPIYAFAPAPPLTLVRHKSLQKLSDADPAACPSCGAEGQVHRQLTAPQFRLAGGGWYETDFKKDGDKKRNLAGDAAKPAESKPEAKPEAGQGCRTASPPAGITRVRSGAVMSAQAA